MILPTGIESERGPMPSPPPGDRGTVVNETGLPDEVVLDAVSEFASMSWGSRGETTFQSYANNQGSLLARSDYAVPTNVIDEIRLARSMADRDDDVRAAINWCIAAAFSEGMENFHDDERTQALFNAASKHMNLDRVVKEFYREYLIAGQINSLMLFTREKLEYQPFGSEEVQEESLSAPLGGVLHAEDIRIIGNDVFGTGELWYDPPTSGLRRWLERYFDPRTPPGEKHAMGMKDRVAANLFVAEMEIDPWTGEMRQTPTSGTKLWKLNPRMVHRVTMPKGESKYPVPPLTANFALLEAKRLLNIMDYALLQGGSNFIVIAKKGDKDHPAQQEEIDNLKQVVRTASRTGVIVGDHRLTFDILTPDLTSLLNPEKRRLIGRKLAMALLRTPEHGTEEPQGEGMKAEMEMMARVISSDRNDIQRHIERNVYSEIRRRNRQVFTRGTPSLWFPKVILQGSQFFTDYILKLRDRGDIPRGWAVEAAGFPFEAAISQRKRELDNDVDETMAPAAVPFSSPEMGPQDNNDGRPPGSKDGRPTNDPQKPQRRINKNPGETIKAEYDPDLQRTVRYGEITAAILEEYENHSVGRIKAVERKAIEGGKPLTEAGLAMVPVNVGSEVRDEKAVNLSDGLRMIVGTTRDRGALVAKLLVFRDPEFSPEAAEETAARWGFPAVVAEEPAAEMPEEVAAAQPEHRPQEPFAVHLHTEGGARKKLLVRDENGQIIGSEEVDEEG